MALDSISITIITFPFVVPYFIQSQFVLRKNHAQIHAQIQSIPGLGRRPSVQLETDRPGVEAS